MRPRPSRRSSAPARRSSASIASTSTAPPTIAAEGTDIALRLWLALKPRLAAEHMVTVYETLERPMVPVLARMEARGITVDRQILSRLSGEFAQKLGRPGERDLRASRRRLQHRLAQAARRHPLRQVRPPRRQEDQDRRLVDRRRHPRRARRRRQHARRPHSRLAPALQAEVDLYRPAAGLHPPRDRPRPHLLCAGLHHHRPPVLVGTQPAEHPGPHRGGPAHPHRLHRRGPARSWSPPITARSSFASSPMSPISASSSRPSPTASTSTP